MSDSRLSESSPAGQEMMTALFAHLVMQQSNMAMMLLGKVPHPETGKVVKDIETARMFIDQLEMLELKTKGNLSKDEASLLKQNLMSVRLAFVEAVESAPAARSESQPDTEAKAAETAEPNPTEPEPVPSAAEDDEHRKKFSKKY